VSAGLVSTGFAATEILGMAGAYGAGLLLVQAGAAKLRHYRLLPGVVANYPLLPEPLIAPFARALPIAELALGAALILGVGRLAALAAAALLAGFAAAMAVNIARGRSWIDCGCGLSQLRQPLRWALVWSNVALAGLLLLGTLPLPAPSLADRFTAAAAGASLFLLVLLYQALGALALSPIAAKRK
jgi:hypothetical protein